MRSASYVALAAVLMGLSHDQVPFASVAAAALLCVALYDQPPNSAIKLALLFGVLESTSLWCFAIAGPAIFGAVFITHTAGQTLFAIGLAIATRQPRTAWLTAPAIWVAIEWLRTVVPLHFVPLGDGFAYQTWFIQVADIGGTYLVAFVAISTGVGIGVAWAQRNLRLVVGAVGLFVATTIYGLVRSNESIEGLDKLDVAVAQMSVPYWVYSLARADADFAELVAQTYLPTLEEQADLLIWPETALYQDPLQTPSVMAALARPGRPALLAGMPRRPTLDSAHNTAWLFPAGTSTPTWYDKRLLVPIIEDQFTAGTSDVPLEAAGLPRIAVNICWESAFGQYFANAEHADLMVVLSDAAAFDYSNLAEPHGRKAVLRAVERRRPMVHASQTGPSLIVDHRGQIVASMNEWQSGVIHGALPLGRRWSFFTATRGAFAPGCALLALGLLALAARKKGRP